MGKRVALVLAGCGVFDGSEIHEASAALVHLSRGGAEVAGAAGCGDVCGFGVAKNLCSWAVDGKNCTVNEHVNSTLQAFHSAKKPIGLCCISPVLAAKVFPGCEVTVGQDKNVDGRFPDAETASAIAELGCKHICKNVNESHVDKANKIVTTCAFMCKAPLHEIFDGIGTMVQEVLKLA
ncbi:hypothetical protein EK904_003166 [Melospiza melodia maxima]|nr:hypothetical protein EK904_003166 [Melospiza melodia maxima]